MIQCDELLFGQNHPFGKRCKQANPKPNNELIYMNVNVCKPVNLNSDTGWKIHETSSKRVKLGKTKIAELLSRFNKSAGQIVNCLDVWALATVALRLVKNLLKREQSLAGEGRFSSCFWKSHQDKALTIWKTAWSEGGQHFLMHKQHY